MKATNSSRSFSKRKKKSCQIWIRSRVKSLTNLKPWASNVYSFTNFSTSKHMQFIEKGLTLPTRPLWHRKTKSLLPSSGNSMCLVFICLLVCSFEFVGSFVRPSGRTSFRSFVCRVGTPRTPPFASFFYIYLAVPSAVAATTHWLGAGSVVMAAIGLFLCCSKVPRQRPETGSHNWKSSQPLHWVMGYFLHLSMEIDRGGGGGGDKWSYLFGTYQYAREGVNNNLYLSLPLSNLHYIVPLST